MSKKFSPPVENKEEATEFYRRRNMPNVDARIISSDRSQDIYLNHHQLGEIGSMHKSYKRGRHVSTMYILRPMEGDTRASKHESGGNPSTRTPLIETYLDNNTRLMVPDRIIPPRSDYTYTAARGTSASLVAFLHGKSVGFVDTRALGFENAKEWMVATTGHKTADEIRKEAWLRGGPPLPPSLQKHESGRNPLTLSEKLRIRTHTLSPAAAREAFRREKRLMESFIAEVRRLSEAVSACQRCDPGAERHAKTALKRARKSLVAAERLAAYRHDKETSESLIRTLEAKIEEAEKVLGEKETERGRANSERAAAARGEKHEAGGNPRVVGKADEKVLRAFLNREPMSGKKISTDGHKIDGHWMGGTGIARWEGEHSITMPDLGSKTADRIQKKLYRLMKEQRVEYLLKRHESGGNPVTMSVKEFEKLTVGRRRRRKKPAPPKRKKRRTGHSSVAEVSLKHRMQKMMGSRGGF